MLRLLHPHRKVIYQCVLLKKHTKPLKITLIGMVWLMRYIV